MSRHHRRYTSARMPRAHHKPSLLTSQSNRARDLGPVSDRARGLASASSYPNGLSLCKTNLRAVQNLA
jgi:hypothetical protein